MTKLEIIYLPATDLQSLPGNPRKDKVKDAHARLCNLISKHGFRNPLEIWRDEDGQWNIIAGNHRFEAGKSVGITEFPCTVYTGTRAEAIARAISDNASSEWTEWDAELLKVQIGEIQDLDLDITGLDDKFLNGLQTPQASAGHADPDEVPEPPAAPVTRPGDLWLMGNHRLLCGNSISPDDADRLMGGGLAHMVFTDPPYNVKVSGLGCHSAKNSIGKIHGEFAMASGEMSEAEFTEFLSQVFANCIRITGDGSIHYICMDWRHIKEIRLAGEAYAELKQLCVWNKDNSGMGTFYRSKHELIFVYKNGKGKHVNNFELGQHGRTRTNVWDYPIVNSFANKGLSDKESRLHPTVKPAQMVADAILDCSRKGDIILDPFLGSGTTLIAAEQTGRTCYGMEISPNYCDVIVSRWERFTGKKAERA